MPFKDKPLDLRQLQDDMARAAYGRTVSESLKQVICVKCGESATDHCYTDAGCREYQISGICEDCWDEMFKED